METLKYKEYTNIALNRIALMRYIKGFRHDSIVQGFIQIKTGLIFTLSTCKFRIREARKERNKIRREKCYKEEEPMGDIGFTRQQFDSCAYSELTHCVIARIEWIKEDRAYLANEELNLRYPVMHSYVAHALDRNEKEVRRLLKMRRVLKKSPYKNWDSRLLVCDMEPCNAFNLYDEFVKSDNVIV